MNTKRKKLIKDINDILYNCDNTTLIAFKSVISKVSRRTDSRLNKINKYIGGIL